MAKTPSYTDANPPKPEFIDDYVLAPVNADYLLKSGKPKQFLHIDQAECITCEGCVDICPWKCIHMVDVAAVDDAKGIQKPGDDPKDNVIFIVDDSTCTRCALCVDRCPTGVITLGKPDDSKAVGDPHDRTERHGYAYGVRF